MIYIKLTKVMQWKKKRTNLSTKTFCLLPEIFLSLVESKDSDMFYLAHSDELFCQTE